MSMSGKKDYGGSFTGRRSGGTWVTCFFQIMHHCSGDDDATTSMFAICLLLGSIAQICFLVVVVLLTVWSNAL